MARPKKVSSTPANTEAVAVLQAEVESRPVAKDERPSRRRNAFNGTEGKLTVMGELPGYHLHIINDSPGRINLAQENGYEFVLKGEIKGTGHNVVSRNTDVGDKVRFLVGKAEDGGPLYGYLMKQKMEFYLEDQAEGQKRPDAIDAAIKKGKAHDQKTEGFYIPKEGIKMV